MAAANADTFVFANGFGEDTISGFSDFNGEKIDLSGLTGASDIIDFADLQSHLSDDGFGNAVITVGANTILLDGFAVGALDNGDFIF